MNVLEKIIDYQVKNERSDAWIARRLCMKTQQWQRIRSTYTKDPQSVSGLYTKFTKGVIKGFPQFTDDFVKFVKNS